MGLIIVMLEAADANAKACGRTLEESLVGILQFLAGFETRKISYD
jgi:hypothetical protein